MYPTAGQELTKLLKIEATLFTRKIIFPKYNTLIPSPATDVLTAEDIKGAAEKLRWIYVEIFWVKFRSTKPVARGTAVYNTGAADLNIVRHGIQVCQFTGVTGR